MGILKKIPLDHTDPLTIYEISPDRPIVRCSLVCKCKRRAFWNFETQSIPLIFGALDSFCMHFHTHPGPS